MLKMRFARKAKLALLSTFAVAGSTMFSSCGMGDIWDNMVAGALAGVKGATTNWVDGLIIDFNEFVEATPDTPIDTP